MLLTSRLSPQTREGSAVRFRLQNRLSQRARSRCSFYNRGRHLVPLDPPPLPRPPLCFTLRRHFALSTLTFLFTFCGTLAMAHRTRRPAPSSARASELPGSSARRPRQRAGRSGAIFAAEVGVGGSGTGCPPLPVGPDVGHTHTWAWGRRDLRARAALRAGEGLASRVPSALRLLLLFYVDIG